MGEKLRRGDQNYRKCISLKEHDLKNRPNRCRPSKRFYLPQAEA